MVVPDFQSIMLPLLEFAEDKQEHSVRDAIEELAIRFKLTDEDRRELLPSGTQFVLDNRTGWSRTYLKKAGLLESKRRGYFNITDKGLDVLNQKPSKINVDFLRQYPEFIEFITVKKKKGNSRGNGSDGEEKTPEETLEYAYQELRDNLAQELIENIKSCSSKFFEKLVIDLLLKMGYGGSRKDTGKVIGGSGDAGIDGIIKEDKLGLDTIYIQAKRWENTVTRPEIQKFVGALSDKNAKKGIFITTSSFSDNAYKSAEKNNVVLIDGEMLAGYMIDHEVGVSKVTSYDVNKMDTDYFYEE
ncbi:restriction endonuclease [Methanobacterium sp. MBAC-LM]|uniref:restriction endonuclease n=1 Tax=Methanobacterium sp. MBAC-LM TaxID=3412034 RepID=UPI003C725ED2